MNKKHKTPVDGSVELDVEELNVIKLPDEPSYKIVNYAEKAKLEKEGWYLIEVTVDEETRTKKYTLMK